MPSIIALSCPVCGAPITPGDERCTFCGAYIFIKSDLPRLDQRTLNQSVIHEHIADFRQRVRKNRYDEEAHYGLGVAYFNLGLIEESVDQLTQAAKLMPENPHIQAQLAVALRDAHRAGDSAAQVQMHSRIQRALLLDPSQSEALLLKAEVHLEKQEHAEAVSVYNAMPVEVQQRFKSQLVVSLTDSCNRYLSQREWRRARWYWDTIGPIDPDQAKALALKFLNLHPSLVPKSYKSALSTLDDEAEFGHGSDPMTSGEKRSAFKAFVVSLIGAGAGILIGLIQLFIVSISLPTDENNSVSGLAAVVLILSFLIMLATPLFGATLFYKRYRNHRQEVQRVSLNDPQPVIVRNRSEILRGDVDDSALLEVVKIVMDKLWKLEPVKR